MAGLILVVYELRLSRQIAQAQLTDQTFINLFENTRLQMGENFDETLARSCFDPESLTDADLIAMNAHFALQIMAIRRSQRLGEFFESFEERAGISASVAINSLLSSSFGREYLRQTLEKSLYPPQALEPIREALQSMEFTDGECGETYRILRESVADSI